MDREPMLVCVEGSLVGRRFPITSEGLRVGRDAGNEVVLEDAGVSRQHARVLLHNGAVWVQDAGSRNGIFVNGERVPDHRAVKVGDRLLVGGTTFEIRMDAPAASAPQPAAPASPPTTPLFPSAPAAAPAPPAPRWKIWPFVVAIVLVISLISCVALLSGRDRGAASAAPQPAYSLSSVLADKAAVDGAAPATTAGAASPTVEQALAVAAGADAASARSRLPDPPAGVSAAELVDRGHAAFDAGRLNEARTNYQMALKLDPACTICTVRIQRLDADIARQAQQQYDAGVRYFDQLQYAEAESAFQTVLLLVPDATDPMHVRATESLQRVRTGAGARPAGQ